MPGTQQDSNAPGRPGRLTELVEAFKAQRAAVEAAQQQLEQRRSEVRRVAELEAAGIIAGARREIGQVLANTRRELLILTAQIQAVGCGPGEPAESLTLDVPPGDPAASGEEAAGSPDTTAPSTRRGVHDVLREARAEIAKLADEARQLRVDVAHVHQPDSGLVVKPTTSLAPGRPMLGPDEGRAVHRAHASVHRLRAMARPRLLIAGPLIALAAGFLGAAWMTRGDAPAGSPAAIAPAADESPAAALPAAAPATPDSDKPAATSGTVHRTTAARPPVSLRVEVRRPVWMRATIDGAAETGRLYAAGESRRLGGEREVSLRAGDAGALVVAAGDDPPAPFGRDGQVLTRRFTASRAAEAAARTTATPPRPDSSRRTDTSASEAATPAGDTPSNGRSAARDLEPDAGPPPRRPADSTPASAPDPVPDVPAPPAAAAASPEALEQEILARDRRWFEAHYAGDAIGMAAVSTERFTFEDARDASARFPVGGAPVTRTLDAVQLNASGVGVVLSGRMTERTTVEGETRESVSMITEVWVRQDDGWRLAGVRLAAPPRSR